MSLAAAALALSWAVQSALPAPVPAPVVRDVPRMLLRSGHPISLVTAEDLSSLDARQGQRFRLQVADDVMIGEYLAIPSGTPAYGEVRSVAEKGMVGTRGRLEVQLLFVDLDGHRVKLDGRAADKGRLGTGAAVGAIVLAGVLGGFVTGTSARLPSGTSLIGYLAKDLEFTPTER